MDKFSYELMRNNIEVRDVIDIGQFNQNLAFTSVQCPNEEKAMDLLRYCVSLGVDFRQKDNLKQTPLFYAAKLGHIKIIKALLENGIDVNNIDIYGQNAFYYAVNNGKFEASKLLHQAGSWIDHIDENGQTPLYYAIKANKADIIEWLLQNGVNINNQDKRGMSPINFAVRHNKNHLKDLLVKFGATPPVNQKQKILAQKQKTQVPIPPKQKVNERNIPKEYVLQILDNGQYRPITEQEFDLLKKTMPEYAELFENEQKIEQMQIPLVDESAPIQYHWEKAAHRMIKNLMKHPKAWIFNEPVQPEKLGINDYFDIIHNPMDFSTIEKKLKHHEYP